AAAAALAVCIAAVRCRGDAARRAHRRGVGGRAARDLERHDPRGAAGIPRSAGHPLRARRARRLRRVLRGLGGHGAHRRLQRRAVPSPSFRMGKPEVLPKQGYVSARLCLITMVLALVAGRLAGQSVERLQARADSLLREWRRANALADMVDSLNRTRAAGGTDTISVGALRIVTNPSPARLREAAARAWLVIDSLYGSEAQQLAQRPYLIAPY